MTPTGTRTFYASTKRPTAQRGTKRRSTRRRTPRMDPLTGIVTALTTALLVQATKLILRMLAGICFGLAMLFRGLASGLAGLNRLLTSVRVTQFG